MKWVTRERAKVDRIACPWLIKKFVDPEAEFIFVATDKVLETAKKIDATPFDVQNVELGHHGAECTFDAILKKYKITDPAALEVAKVVRGADTGAPHLSPLSPGLGMLAEGYRAISKDDHDNMSKQFYLYDAMYAYFKSQVKEK